MRHARNCCSCAVKLRKKRGIRESEVLFPLARSAGFLFDIRFVSFRFVSQVLTVQILIISR